MFRTVSLSISIVHTAMGICHTGFVDCLLAGSGWNSKNKFEKLVYLVGFVIRIYHDARSPDFQRKFVFSCVS